MDELTMNQFNPGDRVYIVRSGMPEYINRMVTVLAPVSADGRWSVEAGEGWAFPNGLTVIEVNDSYLNATPR